MQITPKLKATGIHLLLSSAIFLVALYLIIFHWYPGFLFFSDGGWQGVRIMAFVDIVLGPLMTLIIFNPSKSRREIVATLACIAVAQALALAWGFHAVHSQRPVALVYWRSAFFPITGDSLSAQGKSVEDLKRFGDAPPYWLFAQVPTDKEGKDNSFLNTLNLGLAEYEQAEFLRPLRAYLGELPSSQFGVESSFIHDKDVIQELLDLRALGKAANKNWVFIPFAGKYSDLILVLDRQTGALVHSVRFTDRTTQAKSSGVKL